MTLLLRFFSGFLLGIHPPPFTYFFLVQSLLLNYEVSTSWPGSVIGPSYMMYF
jgi:hypothetical protein